MQGSTDQPPAKKSLRVTPPGSASKGQAVFRTPKLQTPEDFYCDQGRTEETGQECKEGNLKALEARRNLGMIEAQESCRVLYFQLVFRLQTVDAPYLLRMKHPRKWHTSGRSCMEAQPSLWDTDEVDYIDGHDGSPGESISLMSATMLVLNFCNFSSVSRSFFSEVRKLSSEAFAPNLPRLHLSFLFSASSSASSSSETARLRFRPEAQSFIYTRYNMVPSLLSLAQLWCEMPPRWSDCPPHEEKLEELVQPQDRAHRATDKQPLFLVEPKFMNISQGQKYLTSIYDHSTSLRRVMAVFWTCRNITCKHMTIRRGEEMLNATLSNGPLPPTATIEP
ncbi:hypothetical protein A6R68_23735, partial [Neotoma lepida]